MVRVSGESNYKQLAYTEDFNAENNMMNHLLSSMDQSDEFHFNTLIDRLKNNLP